MSTQFDPDGWQYATTLDSPFWHPQNNNALCKFHYRSPFLYRLAPPINSALLKI